jgi:hypothetical protein
MIQARRSHWQPRLTEVEVRTCGFLDREPFRSAGPRLASAFHVAGLDYGWERGIRVPIGAPSGRAA